ncbi:MAG: hypothetical protein IJ686_04925 [Bacteroidales bacterium]|nr:hypothetical protein [Bacteroidales bacterium]
MKKLILAVSALLAMTIAAEAQQISVTSPSQALKLEFRGAKAVASDVELTFLVTNLSENEAVINLVGGQYQNGASGSVVYDNEGNIYEHTDVIVAVGKKALTEQYSAGSFPSNVPVKCHLVVKNIDSYATTLAKVKLCVLSPQLGITNTGICFELNNVKFK